MVFDASYGQLVIVLEYDTFTLSSPMYVYGLNCSLMRYLDEMNINSDFTVFRLLSTGRSINALR